MAVEVKVAPDNQLELKSVFLEDRRVTSQYFNLTELPDTFTGGKNAFLIAGTDYLEPNTEVLVQIKDANGRVVYTESSDGSPEYYEGISKVIAVYVYPSDSVGQAIDSTAFGPCTITILGELKFYDNNGSKTEVPEIWKGKYNVRYIGQANINPTLANTTRVRFFRRPQATITELLKPIYNVSGSSVSASAITASYANIKLSRLETFAGDVKRVKVYRTSEGTVSDFELIQDIQIEAKELLQSFEATGSVVTDTGFFNSEVLSRFWNSGSLSVTLDTDQFSGSTGVKLNGNGNFSYIPKLDLSDVTVYELAFDGFYTGSSQSNLELHISGSQNGDRKIDTIVGFFPTRNLTNYVSQFSLPNSEPSASLYFKQTQGNWFLKDISLRASAETVFSPNEVSFIVSMPTNISNETFNFKFEFFDVNNNYVPVAVTASKTFTGGNDNLTTLATTITGIGDEILSFSGSYFEDIWSGSTSLSGSLTSSVSKSVSELSQSVSSSIQTSYSSSIYTLQTLADGNYSGSFISGSLIYAPEIGGQTGFISGKFTVGKPPNSIVLDATTSTRRIYIGTGTYNNTNTPIYLDSDGKFSLKDKLTFDGTNLSVNGTINVTGGNAATSASVFTSTNNAYNNATSQLQLLADGGYSGSFIGSTTIYSPNIGGINGYISNIFKVGNGGAITLDGDAKKIYIGSGSYNNSNTAFYVDNDGKFSLKDKLYWSGTTLNVSGNINASAIAGSTITGGSIVGTTFSNGGAFSVDAAGALQASNADITGKITATSGKFGGDTTYWTISDTQIQTIGSVGNVSLNAQRGAVEILNSSNALVVDINGGTSFSSREDDTLSPSATSNNTDTYTKSISNIANGGTGASTYDSNTYYSTNGNITFSGSGKVGKSVTVSIQATSTAGTSYSAGTNIFTHRIDMTYGYEIRKGSVGGTLVATLSDNTNVSSNNSTGGTINLPSYSKTFTTTIVLENVTYYIVPFIKNINLVAYTNTGTLTTLTATVYSPKITNVTTAIPVGKTEIIAGGMQVVRDSANYVLIERTGTGAILQVGGSITSTGDLVANTSSDKRLKDNIIPIQNPMDKILKISGNTFNWKDGYEEIHPHSGNDIGVIAQEIENILPEIVINRDNGYKGVHYEKLVALLIEGIKDLQSQIDELKLNK